QLLFEKATEAYLTLSDDDRCRMYVEEIGGLGSIGTPSPEVRQLELDELAEQNYKRAESLERRGDYHFAIELIQQAARTSPKPEYLALLGRCQAQNPQWLDKAAESFRKALELDEDNLDTRIELAKVYESRDQMKAARELYETVLQAMPGHPEASAGRQRLSPGGKRKVEGQGASTGDGPRGWFRRLLGR
ncbi:MAG: tetratricopeptide repeat protein, partial [Acidobacteriota bacterium]|nr:tetratricopeptide repeat protein [Acidobacteriota bacterium]